MKTLKFICLLLLILPLSCVTAHRSPDGAQTYAQIGGKAGFISTDHGFIVQADLEKSLRDAVMAAAASYVAGAFYGAEKAKTAADAATTQTGIKAGAATDQARIKATERAATSLGNNPEAHTGAVHAVRGLFR